MRAVAAAATVVVVAAAGCRGDELTSSGPIVVLQKQAAGGCYVTLTPEDPAGALGLQDSCGMGSATLVAGIDLVRAVIDYDGVEFSGTTHAPPPTVVVTVDGRTSDAPIALQAEKRTDGRSYFLASFVAPNVVSGNIRIDVTVNPGYSTAVPTVLSTAQPIAAISLLARRPGARCLSLLYGLHGQPPDAALGLPAPCPDPIPDIPVLSGVDPLELVIDYGAIDFPAATRIPAPATTVLVDGADIGARVATSPALRGGGHIFFLATLHPPAQLSDDIRLIVTTTPGAGAVLDKVFVTVR